MSLLNAIFLNKPKTMFKKRSLEFGHTHYILCSFRKVFSAPLHWHTPAVAHNEVIFN